MERSDRDWWMRTEQPPAPHSVPPRLPEPSAPGRAADRPPAPPRVGGGAGRHGFLVAGAGGVLTLLAFLALPHLSLPLVGPVSMPSLISFLTTFGDPEWNALWFVPLAAAGIAACGIAAGASTTVGRGGRLACANAIAVLSLALGIGYLSVPLGLTDSQFISAGTSAEIMSKILGVGFYAGALGVLVAFVAALAAGADVRRAGSRNAR